MKAAVFFDLDGTLIQGQSQKIILLHLWRKGQLPGLTFVFIFFWFLLYKLGFAPNVSWVMERAYSLLKGVKTSELDELLQSIVSKKIRNQIFPEALKIIRKYQRENYKVGIISTSIDPLVQILVERLGLDFGRGTKLEEKKGVFTGRILGKVLYGQEKARVVRALAVKQKWDLKKSYTFADSFSDLPFLKTAGHPVVVSPDWRLRKKAEKLHWPIHYWKK